MYTQDSPIYNSGQREIIEDFTTVPPHIRRAILSLTLVVKSVHLGDLSGLVVPSNESYTIRIADLEGQKE